MIMNRQHPVEVQMNLVIVLLKKKMSLHLRNAGKGGLLHVQAQGPMVS